MSERLRERIAAEIFAAEDEHAESENGYSVQPGYPLADQPDETREMYLRRADRILALRDAPADAAPEREPDAEDIARRFHEAYERLAPAFGYETRPESAVAWEQVPEHQRALMIATALEVRAQLRGSATTGRCRMTHIAVEPWEPGTYIVTVDGRPIGPEVTWKVGKTVKDWLRNGALNELLRHPCHSDARTTRQGEGT